MVTYGGMSKKPITVSTSAFIFKVRLTFPNLRKQRIFGDYGFQHKLLCLQDLSLRGFWLQRWLSRDKAKE